VQFYKLIRRSLSDRGIFITQSTSPLFARDAFWCINNTLSNVFEHVVPYHVFVPTFGDWGFNLASVKKLSYDNLTESERGDSFFSKETFINSLHFPEDSGKIETELNTFNKSVLYSYYIKGWKNVDY